MEPDKIPTSKVNLGDLIAFFEEAFYAGWNAALVKADYGEDRQRAFGQWVQEEMNRLGLE